MITFFQIFWLFCSLKKHFWIQPREFKFYMSHNNNFTNFVFRFYQCVNKMRNHVKMNPFLEVWKCRLRPKRSAKVASSTLTWDLFTQTKTLFTIYRTMISALLTALSLMILSSLASADVNYMQSCESPTQCRCDGHVATEVSCRNLGFTKVPDNIPVNITKL